MDYGGYLALDQLLGAQNLRSNPKHHDELLFIVQHQTSELWMKLTIHELRAAVKFVQQDQLDPCFKILARVKQIQRMLFEQWSVLETLTPTEYLQFRTALGHASGLQSHQFRLIEFLLGNKDSDAVEVFRHRTDLYEELTKTLESPSLYEEFLIYLARQGYAIPALPINGNWRQPHQLNPAITQVFKQIYEHPEKDWAAYEMAEKLVDVEEHFVLWRFRHLKTVERIIGFRPGTGGSSGVNFLQKAVHIRLFPELWDVRTHIEPPTS